MCMSEPQPLYKTFAMAQLIGALNAATPARYLSYRHTRRRLQSPILKTNTFFQSNDRMCHPIPPNKKKWVANLALLTTHIASGDGRPRVYVICGDSPACRQPSLLAHHSSSRPAYILDDISFKYEDTMPTTATGIGPVQLCTSCQLFEWPQLPIADRGYDTHPDPPHKTFSLLEESAVAGCTLCQLFWCCIVNSEEVATEQDVRCLFDASLSISYHGHRGGILMNLAVKCTLVTSSSIIRFAPLEADERDWVSGHIRETASST